MYVGAAGQALLRDGLVKGKKWYSVTADYAFGHDLLKVAKRFMQANGGDIRGRRTGSHERHRLFALPAEDPQCQARSGCFQSGGRADHQLHEAVHRIWAALPVGRLRFRYGGRVGCGQGQCRRHLAARVGFASENRRRRSALPPHSPRSTASRRRTRPGATISTKHLAQAMNDIKSTDSTKVAEHMEKGATVRCAEDPRRLLPRVGPSTDAGDVHGHLQARGAGEG